MWTDKQNDTLSYPDNLTPPMRASLLYATCCSLQSRSVSI